MAEFTFTVEVYTPALVFTGSYGLPLYRRVSDALNNRIQRFVTLRDAAIAPLWRPQQTQRVPQVLVDWGDALLVATIAEPPPPADHQATPSPRNTQPMMFFTSAFALRADFYVRTDIELGDMITELADDFIPLRNVTIYPIGGGTPLTRSFVCLARSRILALYAVGTQIANAPLPGTLALPDDGAPAADAPHVAAEPPADAPPAS